MKMKTFFLSSILLACAGLAGAQPTSVKVNAAGTTVTATDNDLTCIFVAPNPATTHDFAVISCYDGAVQVNNLKTEMFVRLNVGDQIGDDFVADNHTISWTLERSPGNVNLITYFITVDGHQYSGTF
jgi:hypothetical protein